MTKKTLILCLILGSSTFISAHCGGCGVGDQKKVSKIHAKSSHQELKLTKSQQKKYDALKSNYQLEISKLNDKFTLEMESVLTKDQKETLEKNGGIESILSDNHSSQKENCSTSCDKDDKKSDCSTRDNE